ncbi:proton-coupled folate transporter-like [Saccoglossus kowalevskii]|uniref:Proton-coupled folate transporter n=1 Tax=Saccoglossus kowalevskii TaxID=10224 RepID=A0ABM0LTW4_SACKO|nr:PREDICTED: proton-coupled folate transporter-like [Saccoglossus kowalevskii]
MTAIRVDYVKKVVAASYDYTSNNDDNCTAKNLTDPHYILGLTVTSEASQWLLYFGVVSMALSLFSGTFLGSYSERGGGRKLPLLVPIVGYTFYMFLNLVFMYLELSLAYFFIAEIVLGLTGNMYTALAISFAYIADVTPPKRRTYRLVILESCVFIGASISQLSTGYWIQSSGLIPPVWMGYSLMIFSVFYIIIWVQDTSSTQSDTSWSLKKQCLDVMHLFTRSSKDACLQLSVLSVVVFMSFLVIGSAMSISMLYLLSTPFCFNSIYIGYYQSILFVSNAIGLICFGKLLSYCLGDLGMAIAGLSSHLFGMVLLAFAHNKAMVFVCVLFTILGCTQAIGICISPVVYNNIYSATVDTQSNAVFFAFAIALLLGILVVSTIQVLHCRRPSSAIPLKHLEDKSDDNDDYE